MYKKNPLPVRGIGHIAIRVASIETSRQFYEGVMGMQVVWQPDPETLYLTFGNDNLALHQYLPGETAPHGQSPALDHFGLMAETEADVDAAAGQLGEAGIPFIKPLRHHRDGSYSFYVADPDGNVIQVLYEPRCSGLYLKLGPSESTA